MRPIIVVTTIGLLGLLAAVALIAFIGTGAQEGRRGRARGFAAGFVLALFALLLVGSYASLYWIMPVGVMVLVGVVALATLALLFLTGKEVIKRPSRLVGLAVLVPATLAMFFAVGMMTNVGGEAVLPFKVRAQQIARANGFVVLMPSGQKLQLDSRPIDPLPQPDKGVFLAYEGFILEERKAEGPATEEGLTRTVRLAAALTPGKSAPEDAKVTTLTVQGAPAVALSYSYVPPESPVGAPTTETGTALAVVLGDVEVKLSSSGGLKESGGKWVPFSPLSVQELAKVAETLEPQP